MLGHMVPLRSFFISYATRANLNKPIQMTLPRMSFEFTNLNSDPSRKSTKNQSFTVSTPDGQQIKRVYSPVPYNMTFVLSIYTKLNDDMLQIIEQILPYFQPSYNLSVKFLGNLNEIRDIPIQLDSVNMEDDYDGNFDTRKGPLVYTLTFTAVISVWSYHGCHRRYHQEGHCWLYGIFYRWFSVSQETLLISNTKQPPKTMMVVLSPTYTRCSVG